MESIRDFTSIVLQSQSFLYSSVLIFEPAVFLSNLSILLFCLILVIILTARFPFIVNLRTVALLLLFVGVIFLFSSFFQAFLQEDLVVPSACLFDINWDFDFEMNSINLGCPIEFCFRFFDRELILLTMGKPVNHENRVTTPNLIFLII